MQNILVTGASGFIGQHLITKLARGGVTIRALVHREKFRHPFPSGIEVIQGDIRDQKQVKRAVEGRDTVFHLAGKAHALSELREDERDYQSINVGGTQNLLEAALTEGIHNFIFFSSVKAMGEETEATRCFDESVLPQPLTAYGRSKLAAEQLVLTEGKRNGIHAVCLRLPLVYGPGNKGNLFRMIHMIDQGLFPPLPKVENLRSMVHIGNVIEAALHVVKHPKASGKCYIITDLKAYSTNEIYETVCKELGKKPPALRIPLWVLKCLGHLGNLLGKAQGRRFIFDSDTLHKLIGSAWYTPKKIGNELGYIPQVTFEDSLPELIQWYRSTNHELG